MLVRDTTGQTRTFNLPVVWLLSHIRSELSYLCSYALFNIIRTVLLICTNCDSIHLRSLNQRFIRNTNYYKPVILIICILQKIYVPCMTQPPLYTYIWWSLANEFMLLSADYPIRPPFYKYQGTFLFVIIIKRNYLCLDELLSKLDVKLYKA